MIVKGSLGYDQHGRKRKQLRKKTKRVNNKWTKATKSDNTGKSLNRITVIKRNILVQK